jgi:hypothetical protein
MTRTAGSWRGRTRTRAVVDWEVADLREQLLRTMTAIWTGLTTVEKERLKITLTGAREVASRMQAWLGLSRFAVEQKRVSARARLGTP